MLLLLIRFYIFSCFVNVAIITKPPGFVIVIKIFEEKVIAPSSNNPLNLIQILLQMVVLKSDDRP